MNAAILGGRTMRSFRESPQFEIALYR